MNKLKEYLSKRGGFVLLHIIIFFIAYNANRFEGFFMVYLITASIYEMYVFNLEKKVRHYEKLWLSSKK